MRAELIPLSSLELRKRTPLKKFPVILGRALDVDVHIDDRWTSRRHCEIVEDDGTLVVRDLASSNGTFVNDAAVCTSPLLPGDELTIGISKFKVSYERDTSKAAPPVINALSCDGDNSTPSIRPNSARGSRATHLKLDSPRATTVTPVAGCGSLDETDRDPSLIAPHDCQADKFPQEL